MSNPDRNPPPARRRLGVRARVTFVATAVVGAALVIAAVLLWTIVQNSLYDGLREAARQDAGAASALVDQGGTLGELDDDRLIQVVAASGTVTEASPGAPTAPVVPPHGSGTVSVHGTRYVVAVDDVDSGGYVIAGRPTAAAEETLRLTAIGLAVGVPVLVALIGVVTWFGVGQSLRPVESMRRQVDGVAAHTLGTRLDDPGTADEIARLAHTLNRMLDRLNAAQLSQRRFVSDASHELKSPLAALRQLAELAKSHPDVVSEAELADAVLDEGARLDHLVQGLLLLAKVDEAALQLVVQDVDLDDLALDEAVRLRRTGLHVDTTEIHAARVRGDSGLLRQLLRNLSDNAARHAHAHVALTTTVDAARRRVVIRVSDDGAGIPPGDRARVFERFVRLDDDRSRTGGGSGLGLAIVDEIVRAHNGTIVVDEDPSLGGARLTVDIPGAANG